MNTNSAKRRFGSGLPTLADFRAGYIGRTIEKPLHEVTDLHRSMREEHMLNVLASQEDWALIDRIVARARLVNNQRQELAAQDELRERCRMDILYTHLNGCPLDLQAFAFTSNTADFAHDFAGICKNINRSTGRLMNGFRPKFAKQSG